MKYLIQEVDARIKKNLVLFIMAFLLLACEKPQPPAPLPPPQPPVSVSGIARGFTLDSVEDLPKIISAIKSMPFRPMVRVVCDYPESAATYKNAIDELSKIAEVIIQPSDSEYSKKMTVAQYKARFSEYINAFPQVKYFESANEISGDWLSKDVIKQAEEATKLIKAAGKISVLVVYWNTPSCSDTNGEYKAWLKKNFTQYLKDNSDMVLISVYGYDCDGPEPSYATLDNEIAAVREIFPKSIVAIGEYGKQGDAKIMRHYLDYPSVGPGLFWFGYQDIVNGKLLQEFVR